MMIILLIEEKLLLRCELQVCKMSKIKKIMTLLLIKRRYKETGSESISLPVSL